MTKEEAARPTQGLDLQLRQLHVCHDLRVQWASGPAQIAGVVAHSGVNPEGMSHLEPQ